MNGLDMHVHACMSNANIRLADEGLARRSSSAR